MRGLITHASLIDDKRELKPTVSLLNHQPAVAKFRSSLVCRKQDQYSSLKDLYNEVSKTKYLP